MKNKIFRGDKAKYAPEIMRRFREIYQEVFSEKTDSFKFGEQWHGFTFLNQANKVHSFNLREIYDFSDTSEFKSFATEFKKIRKSDKIKILAVMSHLSYEGRTSFVTSLAKYAAKQLRLRVLILDYTFSISPLTRSLKSKPHFGVRDVIDGSIPLRNVVIISEQEDYAIIPSIAGFPRNHKTGGRFPQFLTKTEGLFDLILVDTPPFREYPHSMKSIGKFIDGVILLKSDTVPNKKFNAMIKSLKKENVRILGWIANSNG